MKAFTTRLALLTLPHCRLHLSLLCFISLPFSPIIHLKKRYSSLSVHFASLGKIQKGIVLLGKSQLIWGSGSTVEQLWLSILTAVFMLFAEVVVSVEPIHLWCASIVSWSHSWWQTNFVILHTSNEIPPIYDSRQFLTLVSGAQLPVGEHRETSWRHSMILSVAYGALNKPLYYYVCVCVYPQEEGGDHAHTQPLYSPGREAHAAHQHCDGDDLQHSVRGNKAFFPFKCSSITAPLVSV